MPSLPSFAKPGFESKFSFFFLFFCFFFSTHECKYNNKRKSSYFIAQSANIKLDISPKFMRIRIAVLQCNNWYSLYWRRSNGTL